VWQWGKTKQSTSAERNSRRRSQPPSNWATPNAGTPTGGQEPANDPQKLSGAELKSKAETSPADKAKELAKEVAKKNTETLKSILKDDFNKEESDDAHEVSNLNSEMTKLNSMVN
jgi:hypothetical protein